MKPTPHQVFAIVLILIVSIAQISIFDRTKINDYEASRSIPTVFFGVGLILALLQLVQTPSYRAFWIGFFTMPLAGFLSIGALGLLSNTSSPENHGGLKATLEFEIPALFVLMIFATIVYTVIYLIFWTMFNRLQV